MFSLPKIVTRGNNRRQCLHGTPEQVELSQGSNMICHFITAGRGALRERPVHPGPAFGPAIEMDESGEMDMELPS
jgi:hypothetical protein